MASAGDIKETRERSVSQGSTESTASAKLSGASSGGDLSASQSPVARKGPKSVTGLSINEFAVLGKL